MADPAVVGAVAGIAGAVVGASASIAAAVVSRGSAEKIASRQRDLSARELAARGFAKARAAVSSLHPSLVAKLDAFPPSDRAQRTYDANAGALQDALFDLDQASALLAGS